MRRSWRRPPFLLLHSLTLAVCSLRLCVQVAGQPANILVAPKPGDNTKRTGVNAATPRGST
uniref:Uncharacterized protein n=1 Tax=Arundo donax TaxID=35708 RepID=A0A0A9H3V1_ARUDO